jgi:hypothetical protein
MDGPMMKTFETFNESCYNAYSVGLYEMLQGTCARVDKDDPQAATILTTILPS